MKILVKISLRNSTNVKVTNNINRITEDMLNNKLTHICVNVIHKDGEQGLMAIKKKIVKSVTVKFTST
jgi:hypothetical protein